MRTFQLVQLFRDLTAIENVKVGCHLHTRGGVLTALIRPKAARQAEARGRGHARASCSVSSGSTPHADMPAAALTYGRQRLLEIARALAADRSCCCWTSRRPGLIAEETKLLSATIRKIVTQGTTVLLIEHDMSW